MSEKRANTEVMRFTNTGEVYLYGRLIEGDEDFKRAVIELYKHFAGMNSSSQTHEYEDKWLYQRIEELEKEVPILREALEECIIAIDLTRQYVGEEKLPALEGWSWYDAIIKAQQALQKAGGEG